MCLSAVALCEGGSFDPKGGAVQDAAGCLGMDEVSVVHEI